MIPSKFKLVMNYLTRAKKAKPDLPDVFPASQAPIPPIKEDVKLREAVNRFIRDNPRQQKAGGGQLVQPNVDGSRPGYGGPGSGAKPGVSKPVGPGTARPDFISPMKDARVAAKVAAKQKLRFQESEFGKRIQWIANNGKNYNDPEKFKKAYEKHFKHKIGSKKDALFNFDKGAPGLKKGRDNVKLINYRQVDNMTFPGSTSIQPLSTITKNFSEDELFKASIIQNNPDVQKQFKDLFKLVHNDVSFYSELGPEGIVERLNKGKLLKEFDFVKFGVGSGIVRASLINVAGVNPDHLTSYQSVRKPVLAISQIIQNLKNPSFAKSYGISPATATKIRGQLNNFLEGEKNLTADIKKINNQLGDVKFNKIFGGVNFEHTLAKQFGKDYKYLPRNYLLKGQFTTKAFNMFKKDAFDLPLIKLMKDYEKGKVTGEQVQEFIDNFNAKTNGYADFSFDINKGRLAYSDNAVKYDLSRYTNPDVARQELIKNIDLTMSPEFQKGFKNLPQARDQLKLFRSKDAKNIRNLIASFGDGSCAVEFSPKKRDGGRIGYQLGTTGFTKCFEQGVNNFNEGKFKTADQVQDAAKLLRGGRAVISGLMKYGIIPELAYVGLEAAGRTLLGEKPTNSLLKSIDTLTFGATDFKSGIEAEKFGKYSDQKLAVDKFRNSQALVNSLQSNLKNLEAISNQGGEGYIGDLSADIQVTKARLQKAQKSLQENTVSPDILQFIDRKGQEIADTQLAKSLYSKAGLKDQLEGIPGISDYTDTEPARIFPKQREVDLNLDMFPQFSDATNFMQLKTDDAIDLAQLYRSEGKDVSAKDILAYRDLLRNAPLSELAQTYGDEQIYGTQGISAVPLNVDLTNYQPSNRFGSNPQQRPILYPKGRGVLAGGGIAKLAGVDSGPPPASGPNSQGLQGLMKRVKRI